LSDIGQRDPLSDIGQSTRRREHANTQALAHSPTGTVQEPTGQGGVEVSSEAEVSTEEGVSHAEHQRIA